MKETDQPKDDLITELENLRQRNAELERSASEHQALREALEKSEEKFRSVFDLSPQAIALTEIDSGNLIAVNDKFCELTRYSREEVLERTTIESGFYSENDRTKFLKELQTSGEVQGLEMEFKAKDGSDLHALLFARIIEIAQKNLILTIFHDITERKKTEEVFRLTQFAIDHSSDAAFWMGSDARFFYVNDAACRALGYTREELLTMTVHDIDPEFPPEIWPQHWAELKRKGSFVVESQHCAKDGRIFPVEISVNYLTFGGKEYNCAFVRDITERKQIEEQLNEAKIMESIATLAGGIAHEFNNALSGITGNIELLKMDLPSTEEASRYLKPMTESARRMARLTDQLLAYARGGKYRSQTISLNSFVDDTLPLILPWIKPDIRIETDLPGNIDNIQADLAQMQMVLSAVVANAAEAIEGRGRIRIIIRNERIDEDSATLNPELKPGDYVCLTVQDDGKGMDDATVSRIFEPFFTTKFQGRGLGMAAVFGIIKNHGGWIEVDSQLGQGTVVCIYLPAFDDHRIATTPKPAPPLVKGTGTVLIIEDEDTVMEVSRTFLKKLGYRVIEAKTGEEAVALINDSDVDIDLAILDIGLPDLAGDEVFTLIRKARPDLKVIVCSGYAIDGPAQEILNAGAHGFLQKPFAFQTLSAKLKEVLNSS